MSLDGAEVAAETATEIWAQSKIQNAGDWAGPSLASQMSRERLQGLIRVFQRGKLDNMVKVRILIICLFLPRAELTGFKSELMQLAEQARRDDDEWVRVMGEAVGNFDGQLNLHNVCESSSLVRDTVAGLQAGLPFARAPPEFMPLQEPLMHPDMRVQRHRSRSVAHGHFAGPREDPAGSAEDEGRHPLDALLPGSKVWSMDLRGPAPRGAASTTHASIHARRGTQTEGATMFRPSAPTLAQPASSRPAPSAATAAPPPATPHPAPLVPPQRQEAAGLQPHVYSGVGSDMEPGKGSTTPGAKGGVSTGTALLAAHRQIRTQPLQLQEARAATQAAVQAQAQTQAQTAGAGTGKRGRPRKQQAQPAAGPSTAETQEEDAGAQTAEAGQSNVLDHQHQQQQQQQQQGEGQGSMPSEEENEEQEQLDAEGVQAGQEEDGHAGQADNEEQEGEDQEGRENEQPPDQDEDRISGGQHPVGEGKGGTSEQEAFHEQASEKGEDEDLGAEGHEEPAAKRQRNGSPEGQPERVHHRGKGEDVEEI